MTEAERAAGEEIYRLATEYGLRDEYEFIQGCRRAHYTGIVNSEPFSCFIDRVDSDPVADLRKLHAALDVVSHQEPAQLTLFAEAAE